LHSTCPSKTPLEEATAAVPHAHLVPIHDDVTLVCRPNRVEALYRALETRTNPLRFRVRPSKCVVYSPTATDAAALAQKPSLLHEAKGIVVAGSLIGFPSFMQIFGSKTAIAVEKLMETLLALQHKQLLLRLSMVPRLTYNCEQDPWTRC
jgi:hypothetical protein